ncbi:MAG: hypothetical protein HN922_13555 [Anaerolineae bacterium]|nr:hypothetical protein [Anaerolineae bacterium]
MTNNKQPNSKMCFVCGLENPVGLKLHIYQTEPGVIETEYVAPDHFQGYPCAASAQNGKMASML